MNQLAIGQLIQKRCTRCFHDELKIIKIDSKEFSEKVAYVFWTQCPKCGNNDTNLTQADR
ncbi:hypothetical protein H0266_02180 [Halobacillus locisalis]|uniref:Uncharacterized protein n=1 Tax=Halobacillus locisalis TaxID=220753 RepID=A0A838CNR4_9BACI|nr:hypothetical protein [Halobacillus locisalis]MBA2173697.1 hypothetical protein [Halobacillus locisalis]